MGSYKCPTCIDEFDTRRGLGVHHVHAHGRRLPNRECSHCGQEFYSDYAKKYCTHECLIDSGTFAGENHPNYKGGKETTECQICGSEFNYYPSEKKGLYCPDCVQNEDWYPTPDVSGERNPRWNGGKREFECAVCGDTVERHPSGVTGGVTVCSEDCRRTWLSESFTGEGHPNWKGGGNGAYGKGWDAIRKQALERDDHTCRVCGKTKGEIGRNPDVHHIEPVRSFIEAEDCSKTDAHTLDNVITLCVSCHRKADFGKISKSKLSTLTSDC